MKKKNEDLEEDLELDEDEEGSQEDESKEELDDDSGEKKSAKKEADEEEKTEELDEQSADKKEDDEAKRTELRERRKRERKMRRERDKRERFEMQQTITALSGKVRELTEKVPQIENEVSSFSKQNYDSEVQELNGIYQNAQRAMAEAINDSDGEKYTKAKSISDKAFARFNYLETQKAIKGNGATRKQETKQGEVETSTLNERGKHYGTQWVNKNNWYDPNGTTRESKVVQTIDAELYNEGYDPNTKEYWDELTDRAKEFLPNRFKTNGAQKQTVGGGGGDGGSGSSSTEINLPKAFVENLKEAGQWEDIKKRKAAIKYYTDSRKGA